jgi:hypothetical protein
MEYFHTKKSKLGIFLLEWKIVVYFMVLWDNLSKFYLFWGHLVYFSRFGMSYKEKYGNPVPNFGYFEWIVVISPIL